MGIQDNMKYKMKSIIRPLYYFYKDNIDYKTKQIIEKNADLNNKYFGEKIFLLMSGESISRIDISQLKGEFTFGVNWSFIHEEILNLPLTFYLGSMFSEKCYLKPDKYNWTRPPEWTVEMAHDTIKETLICKGTKVFFRADHFRVYQNRYGYDINNKNTHFIKGNKKFDLVQPPETHLDKRFSIIDGSIFTSVIMLINMGFKEIYLCGAGYTYSPLYYLHFYDNFTFPVTLGKDKAVTEAQKAIESRNKKIDTRLEYYGLLEKGDLFRGIYIRRVNKDYPLWKKHRLLNKYAKSQGVKILNITPEAFESPVYEKINWKEVENSVLT